MGTGRGRKREQELERKADNAIAQIKPSPLEDLKNRRTIDFLKDWESGKDVRDIDYLKPYLNLYDEAVGQSQNYAGEGLLGNNALSGSNGQVAGLIGQQLADRRKQGAAGQLYNTANMAYMGANSDADNLINVENNRQMGRAGLINDQYTAYLGRQKKPSIWEQLLQGGMNVAASYAGRG